MTITCLKPIRAAKAAALVAIHKMCTEEYKEEMEERRIRTNARRREIRREDKERSIHVKQEKEKKLKASKIASDFYHHCYKNGYRLSTKLLEEFQAWTPQGRFIFNNGYDQFFAERAKEAPIVTIHARTLTGDVYLLEYNPLKTKQHRMKQLEKLNPEFKLYQYNLCRIEEEEGPVKEGELFGIVAMPHTDFECTDNGVINRSTPCIHCPDKDVTTHVPFIQRNLQYNINGQRVMDGFVYFPPEGGDVSGKILTTGPEEFKNLGLDGQECMKTFEAYISYLQTMDQ